MRTMRINVNIADIFFLTIFYMIVDLDSLKKFDLESQLLLTTSTTTDAMFKHLQSLDFPKCLENRTLNKSIKSKILLEGKRKIQTEILIKSFRQSVLINH